MDNMRFIRYKHYTLFPENLIYLKKSKYLKTQYPNNPPTSTNIKVTLNQTIMPVRNLISSIHMKLNTVAATKAIPIIHQVS